MYPDDLPKRNTLKIMKTSIELDMANNLDSPSSREEMQRFREEKKKMQDLGVGDVPNFNLELG